MTPDAILVVFASTNTLGLIGLGIMIGKMVQKLDTVADEVNRLRDAMDRFAGLPERLAALETHR